jgi:hypothetical protein
MSYAPDETTAQLFVEATFLEGALLAAFAYGAEFMLYGVCMHLFCSHRKGAVHRTHRVLMLYTTVLIILGTVNLASDDAFAQDGFINNRDYPGGPAQYLQDLIFIPINRVNNVTSMIIGWLCDALIVSATFHEYLR